MANSDIKGRIAIVTGAGAGIGRAIAEAFVAAGIRTAGLDVNAAGIEELERRFGRDEFLGLTADITDPASCKAAVDATVERFGGLHVLVNNAALGMNAVHPEYNVRKLQIEDVPEALWQRFLLTNVGGAFNMARQVVPRLRPQGWGRIVNIGTSYFTMLRPGFSPYGPTKAAVEAWSLMLSRELEGSGITVNVVLPGGPTDTGMVPDEPGLDRATLIRPAMMAPPILGLMSRAGDSVTGRRFLAVDWDAGVADPAAQKSRAAAWPELAVPTSSLPKKN